MSSFHRQMSSKEEGYWTSMSRRWNSDNGDHKYNNNNNNNNGDYMDEVNSWDQMYDGAGGGCLVMKKRVMVVVDESSRAKHAMMWALTHVANKGDFLTLLHVVDLTTNKSGDSDGSGLVGSLASLCKACKPEVEVEALVIEGPKIDTVLSQVKKLEVSVLVLGQKKPSPILNCLCGMSSSEELVGECIDNADCLTIGVRKQSRGMGGYLISTRWQKNFWLLA